MVYQILLGAGLLLREILAAATAPLGGRCDAAAVADAAARAVAGQLPGRAIRPGVY